MSTDRLKVAPNERVDIEDFRFLAGESVHANLRQIGHKFFMEESVVAPQDRTGYILSGFAISNPALKQLTVTKGKALLSQRLNGSVVRGVVTTEGDASITLDLNSYASGTYKIYIRFEEIETTNQGRIFWNPSGSGSEYVDSVPTRYQARWALRVESASPGAEWLEIGEVDQATMIITDKRPFYYEGTVDSTYLSGWGSVALGGTANDRNADRQQYGVKDLHTFVRATKQCLEDIKGRGLKRWWDPDIGGMNIGFDADPVSGRLAVGDDDYYASLESSNPRTTFDTFDYTVYDRTANTYELYIGGAKRHSWSATLFDTKQITATAAVTGNGITSTGKDSGHGVLGYGGTAAGVGIYGIGGTTNGTGVRGTGSGTGAGVKGDGGPTNGVGVIGVGDGTGAGMTGTGGDDVSTPGVGMLGTGGENTTSGDGGDGISGVGGSTVTGGSGGSGVKGVGGGGGGGAGWGVEGTGGITTGGAGGDGGRFTGGNGGSSKGAGLWAVGGGATPSGPTGPHGIISIAGANSDGIQAYGGSGGDGVVGEGGSSDGIGVLGVGGTTDGIGVKGLGKGTGHGVQAQGGTGGGFGVVGTGGASNGYGVQGTGDGTGYGVHGIGGTTNGIGVNGQGGASTGTGVKGTGGNPDGIGGHFIGKGDGVGGLFVGGADSATIRLTPRSGSPSTLADGDIWIDSSAGNMKVRIGGVVKVFQFV